MALRDLSPKHWLLAVAALLLGVISVWQLEGMRRGIDITHGHVGPTPITTFAPAQAGPDAPPIVVAHGFAGSRQMMDSYALTLARAGYRVISFDFEGHGRHAVPMSGDVTAIDGTTRKLIDQTRAVVAHATADGSVAGLLGHSMASDVLVRTALEDPAAGPVVAISMYSEAVTPEAPTSLLVITGQYEPHLRTAALEMLRQADPAAAEGDTVSGPNGRQRRAVVAPGVEHVGVLYSATGLREARDWFDNAFGRSASATALHQTGPWVLGLLGAIVALSFPLSLALRPAAGQPAPPPLTGIGFASAVILPAVLAPLLAVQVQTRVLPVLVADYLMLHLLLYGLVQLVVLTALGAGLRGHRLALVPALAFLVWGLGAFGLALDRYGASFVPNGTRLGIIAVLALGTVPFLVADALVTGAGRAALWRRWAARLMVLVSLGLAVALDTERLFFLLIILPVIVLFYGVFGLMGRWVAARGGPLSAGLAMGVILAWSLGVSFPLFQAGP